MTVGLMLVAFVCGGLITKCISGTRPHRSSSWVELPSGWSRTIDQNHNAYAIQISKTDAHWWISRNGRTWIEGPAQNLEMAKKEIEIVVLEFMS